MKKTQKPKTPFPDNKTIIQHVGAGIGIPLPDWTYTTINPSNEAQTLYFYNLMQQIEKQPLVPEELKEKLIWLPESRREELLETWLKRRNAMIQYCLDRINIEKLKELKAKGEIK